jgi:hypothetical protein
MVTYSFGTTFEISKRFQVFTLKTVESITYDWTPGSSWALDQSLAPGDFEPIQLTKNEIHHGPCV